MASGPSFPTDPTPAQKRGSGRLLGFALGCGGLVVLCCGGGVVALVMMGQSFQVKTDPAQASTIASGIADMQLPADLQPISSVDQRVPILNQRIMSIVIYQSADKSSTVMLCGFPGELTAANRPQLRSLVDMQLAQQGQALGEMTVRDTKTVDVKIREQPSYFTVEKGTLSTNQVEYVRIGGLFPSKDGVGMIIVQAPTSKLNDKQVQALINSIK